MTAAPSIATYPDLAGKAVIVTGGASGIGEEIVRQFVRQKCKVAFLDIAKEAGGKLAAETGTAKFLECNVTDTDALRNAIAAAEKAHGPASVLVNNAAHDQRHKTEEVTPEYFDERIAVNLKHQFFAAQGVIPGMKTLGGGSIINFGSTSWMIGQGGMAVYTMAKSAILGFTRSLARDFGPDNIRVNAIAPGWIMTERQLKFWVTPEGEKEIMARQCLKRKLMPVDIAKVVLFLASSESGACTNQHYVVDGGWV
jgi:NAD(P)-dependent dehydrogenase (short-subunit alcohol dehydrogenase family)